MIWLLALEPPAIGSKSFRNNSDHFVGSGAAAALEALDVRAGWSHRRLADYYATSLTLERGHTPARMRRNSWVSSASST